MFNALLNFDAMTGLLANVTLLLALAVVYNSLPLNPSPVDLGRRLLIGLFVAILGVVLMLNQWLMTDGVLFDTRSILLSVSGLFFGMVPTLVAVGATAALRIYQGGAGMWTGVAVICISAGLGLGWRRLRVRWFDNPTWWELYAFGLTVSVVMLLTFLTLPRAMIGPVLTSVSVPVLLLYPMATVLLGEMLARQNQRREATDALAKNQATLSAILSTAQDIIIFSVDSNYRYLTFNEAHKQAMYDTWQITISQNTNILDYVPDPEMRSRSKAIVDRALAGESFVVEQDYATTNKIFEMIWSPIRGADGEIFGATAFVRDVTEDREIERRLRYQSQLLEHSSDAIIATDSEYRVTYWNRGAQSLYGWTSEEIVGQAMGDFITTDYLDGDSESVLRHFSDQGYWEGIVRQPDKWGGTHTLHAKVRAIYDNNHNVVAVVAVNRDISETLETEQRLRFQSLVLEQSLDAIIATDLDYHITSWNRAAETLYGWTAEEAIGRSLAELAPGTYLDTTREAARQQVSEQGYWEGVFKQTNRWGESIYVHNRVALLRDGDGTPTGTAGVIRDITASQEAERRLRLVEAALRAAVNAIVITDDDGTIEWANPAFTHLTGYDVTEAIGKNPRDLVRSGEHGMIFYEDMWRTIKAGYAWSGEMINRRKDGTFYTEEQSITPIFNSSGVPTHFIAIKQDVTERKNAEKERSALTERIAEQAMLMQQIVESVPEGIFLLDKDNRIRLANPTAVKHLSILGDLPHSDRHPIEQQLTTLAGRSVASWWQASSRGLWEEITVASREFEIAVLPVEGSRVSEGWVVVVRDVTEERERVRYGQAQERLATVGQLAAGIAHDFNNIMGVIVLYSQMLQSSSNLTEKQVQRLVTIQEQAQTASRLIGQILDFSRRSVMAQSVVDILPLIKESFKILERTLSENLRLELDYDGRDYPVYADPTRIQQIVMNLAFNARDAMPTGGVLRCTLRRLSLKQGDPLPLPDMKAGNWVHIAVRDTGIGIKPDVLPRIFEPFFTTKGPDKGSGLGLSQVYGIVKQHSGSIDAESEVGKGTAIHIYLPLLMVESTASAINPASVPEAAGETLLVVEDNDVLREAVVDAMQAMGYQVTSAVNGTDAVNQLSQEGSPVDLILTDLVMPDLGGLDLYFLVQEKFPGVKVAIMTGYPMGEEEREMHRQGKLGWIQKPFAMPELADYVRGLLDDKPADTH